MDMTFNLFLNGVRIGSIVVRICTVINLFCNSYGTKIIVDRLMVVPCTGSDCSGKCMDCISGHCVERFVAAGSYGYELNGIYKHCTDWFDY
jgi:hypothetical protein